MEIKKFDQINEGVTNGELLRLMVDLSNNSRLTNETAVLLSTILSDEEQREVIRWMRHAKSEVDLKVGAAKRKFY